MPRYHARTATKSAPASTRPPAQPAQVPPVWYTHPEWFASTLPMDQRFDKMPRVSDEEVAKQNADSRAWIRWGEIVAGLFEKACETLDGGAAVDALAADYGYHAAYRLIEHLRTRNSMLICRWLMEYACGRQEKNLIKASGRTRDEWFAFIKDLTESIKRSDAARAANP